jgi:hypothetical protein
VEKRLSCGKCCCQRDDGDGHQPDRLFQHHENNENTAGHIGSHIGNHIAIANKRLSHELRDPSHPRFHIIFHLSKYTNIKHIFAFPRKSHNPFAKSQNKKRFPT